MPVREEGSKSCCYLRGYALSWTGLVVSREAGKSGNQGEEDGGKPRSTVNENRSKSGASAGREH